MTRQARVEQLHGEGDYRAASAAARELLTFSERNFGAESPYSAAALNDLGGALYASGDYSAAQNALTRALTIRERVLGPDDPATLTTVFNLGSVASTSGRLADAERLYRRAVDARRRTLGPDHPSTLAAASGLALLLEGMGRYDESTPMLERLLATRERLFGPDDTGVLQSVVQLGEARLRQGRTDEAEALFRRALGGFQRQSGADHPSTLTVSNLLGSTLESRARFTEAEAIFRETLAARERVLGPDHRESLISLNNLAANLARQGQGAQAEQLLRQVLDRTTSALGGSHPDTYQAINNLAFALVDAGNYAEAEPMMLESIEGVARVLGEEHPHSQSLLGNLAVLYQRQGRLADAEGVFARVLSIRERTLGPGHPLVAVTLSHLASMQSTLGNHTGALAMMQRLHAILERARGPDHPQTMQALNGIGVLQGRLGNKIESLAIARRVLASQERTLGFDHPTTLTSATNVAMSMVVTGNAAEGEALLDQILDARVRTQSVDHPETATAAANLAGIRLYQPGRGAAALAPARRVAEFARAARRTGASPFAEAEAERARLRAAVDLSLLPDAAWIAADAGREPRAALTAEAFIAIQEASAGVTDRAVARMAIRRVAERRGEALGALVREREAATERWGVINAQYSIALAVSDADSTAERQRLLQLRRALEQEMAALDLRLRGEFPDYFSLIAPEPITLAEAQAMLAPDEAILVVLPTSFGTQVMAVSRDEVAWARSEWKERDINAATLRLLWDVGANVQVSEEQAERWRQEAGSGYPFDRGTAYRLYQQIVDPVARPLAGKRHVFIAAAGALSSLPFGLLVTDAPQGSDGDPAALRATSWFADAHALIQLPSVQSLQFLRHYAAPAQGGATGGSEFVGFGDPLLEGRAEARGRTRGAERSASRIIRASLGAGTRSAEGTIIADVRQLRAMNRLPGTATELRSLWELTGASPASLFLAERATERALRSADLSNARILALATHGLMAGELDGAGEPGLVLTPPSEPSAEDDGYLSASEIAGLNLNADWVILSACNTAAGDGSRGAPGLSGLARAFFYAGARTLLASHWPVRDNVAPELIVRTLALQRENSSLSRAEALQRAMREVRNTVSHDSVDDSWSHPNAWAPFTLIGDGAR